MKIGIAGPVRTAGLAEYLDGDLTDAPAGLGGISVIALVRALLSRGHNISVYSLDLTVTKPVTFKGKSLTLYYGPIRARHRMRDFAKIERDAIRDFVVADDPDVVNAHFTYEFALGALAAKKPTVVTVRDWAPTIFFHYRDLYRLGRVGMHFASLFRADHITANSAYIKEQVEKYVREEVVITPNFLEQDQIYRGPRTLNQGAPRILSANTGFSRHKNVGNLMIAFSHIRREVPNARLFLLGEDFERGGKAECWARANGMADGVEFLGERSHDETLRFIGSSDLLIHPSREESFGLTVLEAMANGTPVIGGHSSGAVPWVLGFGSAGVLTDINSPQDIAAQAVSLLRDPERWNMLSNRSRQHVRDSFGANAAISNYLAVYESAVASAS